MGSTREDEGVIEAVKNLDRQFAIHFDGCLPEACVPINDASRAIIHAVIQAKGHAYICSINRDDKERENPLMRLVETATEVHNFEGTYVLTEPDQELERLMLTREARAYVSMKRDGVHIDEIADRAKAIGAIDLIWT